MDTGEIILVFCRLFLGAAAAFFAILLWSRTRDIAWMLMAGGVIVAYGESLYGVLDVFGISALPSAVESFPLAAVLSSIPVLFFIAALLVMVLRPYGDRREKPSGGVERPE
jgi:membrane protein implicated in regulation of membrane protease activity